MKKFCVWTCIDNYKDYYWETECDNAFWLNEGTPKENSFKFCVYCGNTLVEKIIKEKEIDEEI